MAKNSSEDELNEIVSLNFKITEGERRAFKIWCAGKGITQVEAFKRGFRLLKKQDDEGRS
jgi:hypothetical protein